jgi:carbon monoxide dehydrogenase subunit G
MGTPLQHPRSWPAQGSITVATLVLFAWLSPVARAASIAERVETHAGRIDIEASAMLDADVPTAWRVLTDYPRYTAFIPGLRESRVVAHRGATVIVEQSGDVALWLLRLPMAVTFEITETAPTRLVSHVIAGDLHALESRYTLSATAAGSRLDYTGRMDAGPALLGPLERLAVQRNIARHFQALADEIERHAGDDHRKSGAAAIRTGLR